MKIVHLKTVVGIAAPLTYGVIAGHLQLLIDLVMVAKLGAIELAGVGIAITIYLVLLSIAAGFAVAVQTMVAERVGGGAVDDIGVVLNGGLALTLACAVAVVLIGYAFLEPISSLLSNNADLHMPTRDYLMGALPTLIFSTCMAAIAIFWAAQGKAYLAIYWGTMCACLDVLLNYVFIFGAFGFPRLEVFGAGLASSVAAFVVFIVTIIYTFRMSTGQGFLKIAPDSYLLKKMFRISWPVSVQGALFNIGVYVFYGIVSLLGSAEIALATLIVRLISLAVALTDGIKAASRIIIAHTIGSGRFDNSRAWGWRIANYSAGASLILSFGLLFFPRQILEIYFGDPALVQMGVVPLQLTAITIVLQNYGDAVNAALAGRGSTLPALIISTSTYWGLRLPITYFVVAIAGYGLTGVMLAGIVVGLITTVIYGLTWSQGSMERLATSGRK